MQISNSKQKVLIKTISCIIALTCCIQVAAQSGNGFFDGMAEQERDEYLVAKAKEVVLNFGLEYYREYGEPEISEVMVYNSDNMWREHNGKRFYTVTFRYDNINIQVIARHHSNVYAFNVLE